MTCRRNMLGSMVALMLSVSVTAPAVGNGTDLRLTKAPFLFRSGDSILVSFSVCPSFERLSVTIAGKRARKSVPSRRACAGTMASVAAGRMKTGAKYKVGITARRGSESLDFVRRLYLHKNPRAHV